jgi:hypothetical protein
MNTHELHESIASADLVAYAKKLVQQYTNPDDVEAATKALLVVSLEHLFNRSIEIERLTSTAVLP